MKKLWEDIWLVLSFMFDPTSLAIVAVIMSGLVAGTVWFERRWFKKWLKANFKL